MDTHNGHPGIWQGRQWSVPPVPGSGQFQLRGINKKNNQGLGWKVWSPHRFPLTHTAHTGGVQLKVLRTVAQVAAWGVDTQAIDTVHGVCTFVDV